MSAFSLLETINSPADLRRLERKQLPQLATELRAFLIDSVSQTGGHLSSNLGTVELTIALHAVFNTPEDRLVWDVGHQCYAHKILTGRRAGMSHLRMHGGVSGFPKRSESPYDTFGVGHSSTSISAALGMALAAKHKGEARKAIAIIGDGAMSAGMAFEAMNNAGVADADMLVILNDNEMSISPPVGALNNILTRLMSGKTFNAAREGARHMLELAPPLLELARRAEEHVKGMIAPGTLFEEFGFHYFGPIDGHDLDVLIPTLENLKQAQGTEVPARHHQEGPGLQTGRGRPDPLSRRRQIRARRRHQGRQEPGQADLHPGFRRLAVRHGQGRRQADRHYPGHARRFRPGPLRRGIPGSLLRCRHRRAACRHLCRRSCLRRPEAGRRHLFDLPAARLRPVDP